MKRSQMSKALIPLVAFGIIGWSVYQTIHPLPTDRTEACLSKVNQSGRGLLMYVQDYDNRLPAQSNQSNWMDVLEPYVKNDRVYVCPEVKREDKQGYGYAFNKGLLGQSTTHVPHPSEEPMVFDSSLLGRNATSGLESLPQPPRHRDHHYNIVFYVDGHANGVSATGDRKPPDFFKGSSMGWP